MTLTFHPQVQRDFDDAIAHYESAGGSHLADRFDAELRITLSCIKAAPTRFPPYNRSQIFRHARLKDFPYVVVYREVADGVRVTILRHERRHPLHGSTRW